MVWSRVLHLARVAPKDKETTIKGIKAFRDRCIPQSNPATLLWSYIHIENIFLLLLDPFRNRAIITWNVGWVKCSSIQRTQRADILITEKSVR